MSRVEAILQEIEQLSEEELAKLHEKIVQRLEQMQHTQGLVSKYRGIGQGVWQEDAQEYVNKLRAEDREY